MHPEPDAPWTWRVPELHHSAAGGVQRVSADVGGALLWFECADAELEAAPEAFAALLLLPALERGCRVAIDAPVDAMWLAGSSRLAKTYAGWWGYPTESPFDAVVAPVGRTLPAAGTGACFTGGLDSFYTLLTGGDRFDHLVFVHGFDIALGDHTRMEAFERSFREVAATLRKRAVLLRSNVREHPVVASVNWERSHGAGLAAAGIMLSPSIRSLIVPSSYRTTLLRPWGSHPDTDSMWSTTRMALIHDDTALGREDKLRRIVDEPLVWKHLRVCWRNLAPTGNCSRCHKCVRAMFAVAAYGRAENFTVFDWSISLAARLDALPAIPQSLLEPYRTLLTLDSSLPVRRALERLLARSAPGARAGLGRRLMRYARWLLRKRSI